MNQDPTQDTQQDIPQNHSQEALSESHGAPASAVEKEASSPLILTDHVLPKNLFVIPYYGPIAFPTLMAPLNIEAPHLIATIEEAISRQRLIGLVLPKADEITAKISSEEIHHVGIVARILKRIKMPDGSINILVHSMKRFRFSKVLSDHPHLVVEAEYLADEIEKSMEMDALTRSVVSHVKKLSEVNPFFTDEMRMAMINANGSGTVADLVAFALSLPKDQAQDFLETLSVKARFEKLLVHLRREQEVADLQKKIQGDVNQKLNTMQREFFLKEQLKVIKQELGMEEEGKDKVSRTFRERIETAGMPDDIKKTALEEVGKFETISEQSPEYNIVRNYLETLCSLPWGTETEDHLDLLKARTILDTGHFGLEKVKDRIIEFLAVRKLVQSRGLKAPKGSIICLVGPPGVGKTSIGKSIAEALGRNFYRFSLGGMRDEAEIKGHRRTYVGALPGKFIQAMKRAGSRNPVLLLDEIDKIANQYHGDPASALLEVLDPEQNVSFLDHYLDLPFDLSKVLFVVTANSTATIPAPLLDRMEVIDISGYTQEEKENIASKFVIPKVLKEHGLKPVQVKIEKEALRKIISDYAREPGVRILQQQVEKIARKAAARMVSQSELGVEPPQSIVIQSDQLRSWLGPQRYYNELAERITVPGVVVGLAWTQAGGDILFIEATDLPGSGNIKLTGQMGEVMSESAAIAWTYVKKKIASERGFTQSHFKSLDMHLHIPAGAIPKDGPSAGVSMATALYSLLTGRVLNSKIAMTGELSLVGKVLPVGGIKEKVLAARRSGVTTVILPELNRRDLDEIPDYVQKSMTFHFVSRIEEVFKLALSTQVQGEVLGARSQKTKIPVGAEVAAQKAKQNRKDRKNPRSIHSR